MFLYQEKNKINFTNFLTFFMLKNSFYFHTKFKEYLHEHFKIKNALINSTFFKLNLIVYYIDSFASTPNKFNTFFKQILHDLTKANLSLVKSIFSGSMTLNSL